VFSDEATFHLVYQVSRYFLRFWKVENPQVVHSDFWYILLMFLTKHNCKRRRSISVLLVY